MANFILHLLIIITTCGSLESILYVTNASKSRYTSSPLPDMTRGFSVCNTSAFVYLICCHSLYFTTNIMLAGFYIYIESSSPRVQDDVAVLTFTGTNSKPIVCLSFYYHMYGTAINYLYLYNHGNNIWRMAGDQGNAWKKAQITIIGDYQVSESRPTYKSIQNDSYNFSYLTTDFVFPLSDPAKTRN